MPTATTKKTEADTADVKEEDVPVEEGVGRGDPIDGYILWDSKAYRVIAGPFVDEDSAKAAQEQFQLVSNQWAVDELTVEKVTLA